MRELENKNEAAARRHTDVPLDAVTDIHTLQTSSRTHTQTQTGADMRRFDIGTSDGERHGLVLFPFRTTSLGVPKPMPLDRTYGKTSALLSKPLSGEDFSAL